MFYPIRSNFFLKSFCKRCIWRLNPAEKKVYLTFDDGPNPDTTPFILEQLKRYEAQATFFCIGKNVEAHPDLHQQIFSEGHLIGNHTYSHLNGWKTKTADYLADIEKASDWVSTSLFRPPYGKIKRRQVKEFSDRFPDSKIIMWDVLSGDFDPDLKPQDCLQNVLFKFRNGSIIVFHDSNKAMKRMTYTLPRVLEHFKKKGYEMEAIDSKFI